MRFRVFDELWAAMAADSEHAASLRAAAERTRSVDGALRQGRLRCMGGGRAGRLAMTLGLWPGRFAASGSGKLEPLSEGIGRLFDEADSDEPS